MTRPLRECTCHSVPPSCRDCQWAAECDRLAARVEELEQSYVIAAAEAIPDARNRIATLEQQLAEAREERAESLEGVPALMDRALKAESALAAERAWVQEAISALEQFGRHVDELYSGLSCNVLHGDRGLDGRCDCGLDAALARLRGGEG